MNTSLVKYKDLALKVVYYTKRRQLGTKIFFATSKFQDVLQYFEKNLKDPQTYLKSCYFLNGKQIYPNDTLLYYCTVDPNLRLVEEDLFIEVEELEHLDDSSEPIYETLLKPLIDPFKLIILNIKDGILQMVDFPKEKITELGLDTINNNYACCNSTDSLYISCGKNFWIIPHNSLQIERKDILTRSKENRKNFIKSINNNSFGRKINKISEFGTNFNNNLNIPIWICCKLYENISIEDDLNMDIYSNYKVIFISYESMIPVDLDSFCQDLITNELFL